MRAGLVGRRQNQGRKLLAGFNARWMPATVRARSGMSVSAEQLEEERFAEGERTMSEAERRDLYEPAGCVAAETIESRHLADRLATAVADA